MAIARLGEHVVFDLRSIESFRISLLYNSSLSSSCSGLSSRMRGWHNSPKLVRFRKMIIFSTSAYTPVPCIMEKCVPGASPIPVLYYDGVSSATTSCDRTMLARAIYAERLMVLPAAVERKLKILALRLWPKTYDKWPFLERAKIYKFIAHDNS